MLRKKSALVVDCVKFIARWSTLNLRTQSKHLKERLRALCLVCMWRGLSPRLARAIPDEELPNDERTDEKKSDEDSEDKTVAPIESHHEEDDV